MLPDHHLLSQIPLRADSVMRKLHGAIWQDALALAVQATEARAEQLSWSQARKLPLHAARVPEPWGKLFDQRWCHVVFPRKTGGSQWLHWKDEGEATLYVQGRPFFGFDVGHKYCRLPAGLKEVWIEANCVQSAIWHPDARGLSAHGSVFEGAFLVHRDDDAWHAWHDLKCLLDVALSLRQQENASLLPQIAPGHTQAALDKHSPSYRRMLRWLDDACTAIERDGPAAGRRIMTRAYVELRAGRSLMQATLTGHAHIDLVWLWPERIGELKTVHTFSTVNRLMDEYPEFRFAYSQPASYEAVQRRSPELYGAVRARMKSGRWQATGAMYVESDTLIACGEALFRSFLVGQEEFTRLAGKPSRLTWLPDVFGYSACLPQMMKLAGADYFFTTKLTWNLVNRFPYSSFVWRGNDGSEVVAHVTQDSGYCSSLEAAELKNSSWGHQQGDIHGEYLLPTGYGDGGGGPTAEMCERARRLDGLPGMPAVKWDQPEAFFDRLAKLKNRLPVHTGECYVEGHRGTYTTHGSLKAAFRELERTLQISEAAACVTGKNRDRAHAWKRMIFAQFHDYIPGSSVWDVYAEGIPELQALTRAELTNATDALSSPAAADALFNPHAVEITKWLTPPGAKRAVRVRLPALSGVSLKASQIDDGAPVVIEGLRATSDRCELRLDKNGWIKSLRCDGQNLALAGPAGQLLCYTDKPSRFEAWDIDRHTLAMGRVCDATPEITPFSEGHRAGFRVKRPVGEKSSATVEFAVETGSPLLHVTADLDWRDEHALLKFFVPTQHRSPQARFGIPYGSVLRPQVVSGPLSEAMWETPFSRWLAVFDECESNGLFLVTEAKYGATVRDGAIGLSLVRSPLQVGYDNHRGAWPPALSRLQAPSQHTDIGRHHIRLALCRYQSALSRADHPASRADTLFTDPLPYRGASHASPLESLDGGDTLIPAWAQPLDASSWLLRLHEVGGQRGRLVVRPAAGWTASPADAKGNLLKKSSTSLRVEFTPHQIVSVVFHRTKDLRK
ncbi:MAG: alpha-mannosidase [Rariglobus sp.]|jgi:alpha-mannosidase|nr:alpha-mannosidase [Rariglobus sp.]